MRLNMPFGRVGAAEFGTYFIGYARSPDVIEQMLDEHVRRPARPAPTTGILDFSTAVTGSLFFVPRSTSWTTRRRRRGRPPPRRRPRTRPGTARSRSGACGAASSGRADRRPAPQPLFSPSALLRSQAAEISPRWVNAWG